MNKLQNIAKYCEIKYFSLINEIKKTNFINTNFYYNKEVSYYSDVVRYLLLYNYKVHFLSLVLHRNL